MSGGHLGGEDNGEGEKSERGQGTQGLRVEDFWRTPVPFLRTKKDK